MIGVIKLVNKTLTLYTILIHRISMGLVSSLDMALFNYNTTRRVNAGYYLC